MTPRLCTLSLTGLLLTCFACHGISEGFADDAIAVDFENDVAPILIRRCLECHQATNASGGLALDTSGSVAVGGGSGPALSSGSSSDSLLFQRIRDGEMPPPQHGETRALPENEVESLRLGSMPVQSSQRTEHWIFMNGRPTFVGGETGGRFNLCFQWIRRGLTRYPLAGIQLMRLSRSLFRNMA